MKRKTLILSTFALLTMMACKKTTLNNQQTNQQTVYSPTCSGTKSFKNDVFPLMQSNCTCHSNFTSYAQISADSPTIRTYISDGTMPKNGSLSNAQKDIILCWIDSGKLNN